MPYRLQFVGMKQLGPSEPSDNNIRYIELAGGDPFFVKEVIRFYPVTDAGWTEKEEKIYREIFRLLKENFDAIEQEG